MRFAMHRLRDEEWVRFTSNSNRPNGEADRVPLHDSAEVAITSSSTRGPLLFSSISMVQNSLPSGLQQALPDREKGPVSSIGLAYKHAGCECARCMAAELIAVEK